MNQGSRAATVTQWSRTGLPLAGDLAGRSEAAPANVSADLPVPGCSASPRYQAVHMPHLFPAMMRYRYSAERIGCGRLVMEPSLRVPPVCLAVSLASSGHLTL